MVEKSRVLILCTGNSARSQMAEALINDRLGDRWEAVSAGTHPAQDVHPQALKALEEMGIQHSGHPKLVDQFRAEKFDLVITVCDEAAEERPFFTSSVIVTLLLLLSTPQAAHVAFASEQEQ